MAKQTQGALGTVKGKVGNVVGAQWKQTPYFRSLVIPANPNSAAQQVQRGKLSYVVNIARLVLSQVIQPLWDPFQRKQSGYNRFTSVNVKAAADTPVISDVVMTEGQLEAPSSILGATYDDSLTDVNIAWPTVTLGNGDADDTMLLVVIDTENNVAFIDSSTYVRSDSAGTVTVGTGRTAADLAVFVAAFRGTGTDLIVANSLYSAVTAV